MAGQFVHTNRIRLHVLEYPGGDPALVLLHGLTANAHVFDGLAVAGLSPRYRLVTPDLRGRGLSDKPPTGYTMADHAADILGLLDALGQDRVVLGGHSFGGLLTLYVAAHYPDRVAAAILLDVSARLQPNLVDLLKPTLARLERIIPSWEAYLDEMKQMPFYHEWWNPVIERYYRADVRTNDDGTVQPHSRPEYIQAAIESVLAEPWETHLEAVTCPALLLNAIEPYGPPGAPPLTLPADARATAEALADCRYEQAPGNHMTMLFGAGANHVAAAIMAFIGQDLQGTQP